MEDSGIETRRAMLKKLPRVKFNGKILILGFGAVAQCTLPMLPKLLDFSMSQVTILDMDERTKEKVTDELHKGAKFVVDRLTEENLEAKLASFGLAAGDILMDLTWEISTTRLLTFCHDRNILYINASVEVWHPYFDARTTDPREFTLYKRNQDVEELVKKWGKDSPTAVLDHGANPGLVSHFTKLALRHIAEKVIREKAPDARTERLIALLAAKDWARLAQQLGVKVIHISERDTQITNKPKRVGEFVNTWSPDGLYEEGVAPAELGWGTHERTMPNMAVAHDTYGPRNQILLKSRGMNTTVRSWVPNPRGGKNGEKEGYEILGMVIRHGEAYTISKNLTVRDGSGQAIYRPTVHYAYCPGDSAIASLQELRMNHYELMKPSQMRVIKDEIISGEDILGCLLMGHDFGAWWIGTMLTVEESRELVPHQNATTVQVASSLAAAVHWMVKNPRAGVCVPDDLPHDEILPLAMPFLGPFISRPVDWNPIKGMKMETTSDYMRRPIPDESSDERWQFSSFLFSAF